MKKLILLMLTGLYCFGAIAQDARGNRVIANQAFYLKDKWVTGISGDTSAAAKADDKLITERAAKTYADSVKRRIRLIAPLDRIDDTTVFIKIDQLIDSLTARGFAGGGGTLDTTSAGGAFTNFKADTARVNNYGAQSYLYLTKKDKNDTFGTGGYLPRWHFDNMAAPINWYNADGTLTGNRNVSTGGYNFYLTGSSGGSFSTDNNSWTISQTYSGIQYYLTVSQIQAALIARNGSIYTTVNADENEASLALGSGKMAMYPHYAEINPTDSVVIKRVNFSTDTTANKIVTINSNGTLRKSYWPVGAGSADGNGIFDADGSVNNRTVIPTGFMKFDPGDSKTGLLIDVDNFKTRIGSLDIGATYLEVDNANSKVKIGGGNLDIGEYAYYGDGSNLLGVFKSDGGSLTGTAGYGYLGLIPQSSAPATPASGVKIYTGSGGLFSILNTLGYSLKLDGGYLSANHTLRAQNKDYTIADSATVALKAPIASPTFTGTVSASVLKMGTTTGTGLINLPDGGTTGPDGISFGNDIYLHRFNGSQVRFTATSNVARYLGITVTSGGVNLTGTGTASNQSLQLSSGQVSSMSINIGSSNNDINIVSGSGSNVVNFAANGSVAIGSSSPASSAALDMQTTTKGFLPPRLTASQASAIASPAKGLMLYVTDTNGTFTSAGWWGYSTSWKLILAE